MKIHRRYVIRWGGRQGALIDASSPRRAGRKAADLEPRYAAGSLVVVLEPDVAAAFPSAGQANEALRALAGIIQKHRPRRTASGRNSTHR